MWTIRQGDLHIVSHFRGQSQSPFFCLKGEKETKSKVNFGRKSGPQTWLEGISFLDLKILLHDNDHGESNDFFVFFFFFFFFFIIISITINRMILDQSVEYLLIN